jgi:hypothetical protein
VGFICFGEAMRSEVLVTALERGVLPPSDFTHERHVQAAWHYLRQQPLDRAAQRFVSTLQAYVNQVGAQSKFHLTMSVAFMHLIHSRIDLPPSAGIELSVGDWHAFRDANPDLFSCWRKLIAVHYSDDALGRGREVFVAPDREPLPGLAL